VQNSQDIIMLLGIRLGTLRSSWRVYVSSWPHFSQWNKKTQRALTSTGTRFHLKFPV